MDGLRLAALMAGAFCLGIAFTLVLMNPPPRRQEPVVVVGDDMLRRTLGCLFVGLPLFMGLLLILAERLWRLVKLTGGAGGFGGVTLVVARGKIPRLCGVTGLIRRRSREHVPSVARP